MKKAAGWMIAWCLFLVGDFVSKIMNTGFTGWMYTAYNRLMCASLVVQDWSGASGPWKEPNEKSNVEAQGREAGFSA